MRENTNLPTRLRSWFAPLSDPATAKRAAYLFLTFPTGIFWFVTSVTLASMGLGMLIIMVGFAIIGLMLVMWRAGAAMERTLAATLAEVTIPAPPPRRTDGGAWQSIRDLVMDGSTWRAGIWLFLLFPLGIMWFTVLVTIWSVAIGLAAAVPVFIFAGEVLNFGSTDATSYAIDSVPEALVVTLIGTFLLPLVARFTVAAGNLHASLAKALLGPSSTILESKVVTATHQRDQSVATAESERRRIERDLHDGAQQRLVAVAMELGRAREKLEEDPAGAKELVDEAHTQAKAAIVELRDLARGIHPAVLTDRGLDPALSALAARSPIPVVVDYRVEGRPPVSVESAAYFVVSESLANVGKHALASIVEVTISPTESGIEIDVTDDGVGGAVPTGSGLSGLADRVESLGGALTVISPIGGPTTVIAELPCEW